jgi:hypothetical protein
MATESKIALLKDAVLQLKKDGVQNLSVAALLDYVTKLEAAVQERREPSAAELEHYKAQLSAWVEKQKEASAINVEGFKSVILAGQNALRSALLVNGGAAVALLAYIGKLSVEASAHVSDFALPLLLFVLGALVVVINSGFTYLGHWTLLIDGFYRDILEMLQKLARSSAQMSAAESRFQQGKLIWRSGTP